MKILRNIDENILILRENLTIIYSAQLGPKSWFTAPKKLAEY